MAQSIVARRAWQKQYRLKLRALVAKEKDRPCMDCGLSYPSYVMDFDHRGNKIADVSDLVESSHSLKRITTEIEKCDVVCSNCHRLRTFASSHTIDT